MSYDLLLKKLIGCEVEDKINIYNSYDSKYASLFNNTSKFIKKATLVDLKKDGSFNYIQLEFTDGSVDCVSISEAQLLVQQREHEQEIYEILNP